MLTTMLGLLQRLTVPPEQALTILQPTSTTVRFTVSTRPVPKSLPAVARYYVSLLFRVLLGLLAGLILLVKWERRGGNGGRILGLLGLEDDVRSTQAIEKSEWRFLLPAVFGILWLVLRRGYIGTVLASLPIPPTLADTHTEESLLIIRDLGIQTSSTSPSYLSTPTIRFIPTTSIQDILIHEAFIGFEVRFYLAIVVEGEQDVVVVFPKLLPRRDMLETIWRGSRACLWGFAKGKGKDKADLRREDGAQVDAGQNG